MSAARHTDAQLDAWRRDGAVVLEALLSPDEIAPVEADFLTLYGSLIRSADSAPIEHEGRASSLAAQFAHTDDVPLDCSPALNLLGLHPALAAFARDALETDDVHLYQCHTWAKFTGATDYDQAHHCDYNNHTLTVPADDQRLRTVNFIIHITDVTDALGATHFVPWPDSDPITGPERWRVHRDDPEVQARLRAVERSAAAPGGSVLAYGIDTYHRGTNLTEPGGHRFTLTASYKAAGNDMIGFNAWQRSFRQPWDRIIEHATPDQLACLGIPRPGDRFWTERTIARTRERWPGWDHRPYETASS